MRSRATAGLLLGLAVGLGPATAGRVLAQGLPFHTPTALTTAFEERALRASSVLQVQGELSTWTTTLTLLPWAPSGRVTTLVVLPFVRKAVGSGTGPGELRHQGLGDLLVGVKWALLVRNRPGGTTRLALLATGRLPTGASDLRLADGQPDPRPYQLGTGAGRAAGPGVPVPLLLTSPTVESRS